MHICISHGSCSSVIASCKGILFSTAWRHDENKLEILWDEENVTFGCLWYDQLPFIPDRRRNSHSIINTNEGILEFSATEAARIVEWGPSQNDSRIDFDNAMLVGAPFAPSLYYWWDEATHSRIPSRIHHETSDKVKAALHLEPFVGQTSGVAFVAI